MRKFSKIFLLLQLAFFSTLAVNAQTAIVTSDEPSSSGFADGTVWFTMKLYGNSISAASSGLDTSSYFYANSTTIPSDDASLWCIVGNATDGYKFYNKSEGVSKVFAINNTTGDNGGNIRAQLVDATTTHSTEDGEDNWATTFDITPVSTGSTNYYVSAHGASSKCLNKRGNYVSTWTTGKDAGSYVTFNNPVYTLVQAYGGNNIGKTFRLPSSDETTSTIETLQSSASSLTVAEIISGSSEAITTFKQKVDENYVKPSADKLYIIRCAYNNRYLSPDYYVGSSLSLPTSSSKKSVWQLEENSDGTFKLKNVLSGYYVAGSSSFALSETGTDYTINNNGIVDLAGIIGVGTNYNAHQFIHGNSSTSAIAWAANAGASRWYFDEVSEDDFKALYPATADNMRDMLSICVPSVISASESDVNSFVTTPTSDTFRKILAASESQDGMYVRLTSGKSGNKVLALSSDYTTVYANANSTMKTDVATIWQLVKTSATASSYNLKNMNSGTYIGSLINASGSTTSSSMVEAQSDAIKVTFTKKNSNTFNVIDGSGNKMNDDGRVNYWTDNGNPGWMVFDATDIEVALHELGDASYATIYLPVSVSSVANATAYVAKSAPANNQLTVTSTEGFAANAGVVLVSDSKASTATLTLGEATETSLLSGTNTPLSISDASSYLVFGPKVSDSSVVGFYQPASSITSIPANRAFYQNTSSAISLNFNGSVTGIEQFINGAQADNAPVFDLTGRKVAKAAKGGIYIQNGKKFIVK